MWEQVGEVRNSDEGGRPLYERIARVLEDAIRRGELADGDRLPTVRELATQLQVSTSTIVGVYNSLRADGLIRGEVGRGTFISSAPGARTPPAALAQPRGIPVARAWRRRSLADAETRLRAAFPHAADLMRGGPDPDLLPVDGLRKALRSVTGDLTGTALQYPPRIDPDPELRDALLPRLAADGIPARPADLLIANSSQQLLSLVAEEFGRAGRTLVAVEEPGYQTAMDTFERAGLELVGMSLDEFGVTPESLGAALAAGAGLVLFTPRAQSPTSVGWTPDRRAALADVLAEHPEVWIFEDDQFAEAASSRPGSLISDPRLRGQVVYARSFSKSLAPDLRLAAAVVTGDLHAHLAMAKSFADGWTSRMAQRTLARLLTDPETDRLLHDARNAYAERRAAAAAALSANLEPSAPLLTGVDGLHLWIPLPPACDTVAVLEEVARAGFLAAASDPFYVHPGHDRYIRLNAGTTSPANASAAAEAICAAIERVSSRATTILTP